MSNTHASSADRWGFTHPVTGELVSFDTAAAAHEDARRWIGREDSHGNPVRHVFVWKFELAETVTEQSELRYYRPIDPKYGIALIDGLPRIVKNGTFEPIPDDEPLFLLRGRDRLAVKTLLYYLSLAASDGCTEFHMTGTQNRVQAFTGFAIENPRRMKQPGITRGK